MFWRGGGVANFVERLPVRCSFLLTSIVDTFLFPTLSPCCRGVVSVVIGRCVIREHNTLIVLVAIYIYICMGLGGVLRSSDRPWVLGTGNLVVWLSYCLTWTIVWSDGRGRYRRLDVTRNRLVVVGQMRGVVG